MNQNRKYGDLELIRFIGILLIMSHHLYLLGYSGEYIFAGCWVWVDFYFMISGALTAKHFMNKGDIIDCGTEALGYTWHKFKRLFLYAGVSIVIQHGISVLQILKSGSIKEALIDIYYMPFEMMLLSTSGIVRDSVPPLWYLSAMFIVFPLLVYILTKHREFSKVLSLLYPILYFGYNSVNTVRTYPNDLLRALACLCLGVFAFDISLKLEKYINTSWQRGLLTAIAFGGVSCAILIPAFNLDCMNLVEVAFLCLVTILFSRKNYFSKIQSEFCEFLGNISVPAFIFHWNVGTVACLLSDSVEIRTIIYYIVTLLVATMIVLSERAIKLYKSTK